MPTPTPPPRLGHSAARRHLGEIAPNAQRSARLIMGDAFQLVVAGRSTITFFTNAARVAARTMSRSDVASIGVGLAVSAGVAIATLATGGLALPVLIGLGAAGWALSKAVSEIGADHNRNNRNWLQRLPNSTAAKAGDTGAFLTCEASDALRRAVDHYRMMTNEIIPDLKKADDTDYVTCEQVLNHIKAVSRFIHHGDKVRNYALPVLDLLIFYMKQYQELAEKWTIFQTNFDRQLDEFYTHHPMGSCRHGSDSVCYGEDRTPRLTMSIFTIYRRHPDASGYENDAVASGATASAAPNTVDVAALAKAMQAARDKIVLGMHLSADKTWNYSAARPGAGPANKSGIELINAASRVQKMLDKVWQEVDRPGYYERAVRRAGHWYTRNNKSEKLAGALSELLGMGSIFTPFMKGAEAGMTALAKGAISGAMVAGQTLADKVGTNILRGQGDATVRSGLLNQGLVEAKATEAITSDMRGSGAAIQKIMPKMMLHFGKAAAAIQELEKNSPSIGSCDAAMGYCLKVSEVVYQMEKVGRYAGPCIGIIDALCNACDKWTEQEAGMWEQLEEWVTDWVVEDAAHEDCRTASKKCYGAKHTRVNTSFLGRGGSWKLFNQMPHNPI